MTALINDERAVQPRAVEFIGAEIVDKFDLARFAAIENFGECLSALSGQKAEIERADPAREALGEQEIAMLRRALSELPRRRRAIVTAARLNDVPHKEIAARHGVSLRTVEKELKAGLEHCCKRLDREYIQRFGPKIKRPPS